MKEKMGNEEGEMRWCVKKGETEIDGSVQAEQGEAEGRGGGKKKNSKQWDKCEDAREVGEVGREDEALEEPAVGRKSTVQHKSTH